MNWPTGDVVVDIDTTNVVTSTANNGFSFGAFFNSNNEQPAVNDAPASKPISTPKSSSPSTVCKHQTVTKMKKSQR